MRLYTLSIAAYRDDADNADSLELAIQSVVALHIEETPFDADCQREIAEDALPLSEGWVHHHIAVQEITNPFDAGGYILTWRAELSDPPTRSA